MEITLLKREQTEGDNALTCMKEYGSSAPISDLAIILGADVSYKMDHLTPDNRCSGYSWLADRDYWGVVYTAMPGDKVETTGPSGRRTGFRPALSPEETIHLHPNNVQELQLWNDKKIQLAEYGFYPQTVADMEMAQTLDNLYYANNLHPNDNESYVLDANGETYCIKVVIPDNYDVVEEKGKKRFIVHGNPGHESSEYELSEVDLREEKPMRIMRDIDYSKGFEPKAHPVYEYNGEKYIRVKGNSQDKDSTKYHPIQKNELSDGQEVESCRFYWVKVEPIKWIVDKSGWWVSHQILVSGIQYDELYRPNGNFKDTNAYQFLNNYFAPNMQQGLSNNKTNRQKAVVLEANETQTQTKQEVNKQFLFGISQNNLEVIEDALRKHANIDITDENGETALMRSAKDNNRKLVNLLLRFGADKNCKNKDGKTAIDIAKECGHEDIAKLIDSKKMSSFMARFDREQTYI